MKGPKNRLHNVMVVGATPAGIAATTKLGEIGIPVTLVETEADLNEKLSSDRYRLDSGVSFNYSHRPGLIRIFRNASIRCLMPATIEKIRHSQQGFNVRIKQQETFVNPNRCTLCGQCVSVCPVNNGNGQKPIHIRSRLSLPGQAVIDKRKQPLCQANCPLGVNAQGYIALAGAGRYEKALNLIRNDNVLPGICGRVCTHPCEDACRRAELDEPLAIRNIKRFVADSGNNEKTNRVQTSSPRRSERVAIIGAGPAGLAAATDLARAGLGVTVFEKETAAGGLLRYGIGPHRLPREILDKELEDILAEGVHITTGRSVNIAKDLGELRKTFNAVVLATGSWADRRLGVPGEDMKGVQGCLGFLTRVYRDQVSSLDGNVAVIGDGNAAFDMARTLKRLGAEVTIFSWFAKEEIPADAEEVESALAEGIHIQDRSQVVAFIGDNGKLQGLRLKPTRPGPCDAQGIAWPEVIPGSKAFEAAFDQAFVAIGQTGAYKGTPNEGGLNVTDHGYICSDNSGHTGLDGIYVAGDATTGATSVVHAMANGRKTAARVIENLIGPKAIPQLRPQRPEDRDYDPVVSDQECLARVCMPEASVTARHDNFCEVALGYNDNQVCDEAMRCLQCGSCSQCLECLDACDANRAICHDQFIEETTENTGVIIIADPSMAPNIKGEDVIRAYGPPSAKSDVNAMVQRGFAAAAKAMVLLKETATRLKGYGISYVPLDTTHTKEIRIGVFACRCNDSFGWSTEMNDYLDGLVARNVIVHAEVIPSACIPEGTTQILNSVRENALTRIVLASCVCCPLDYICSACTEQRSRLKEGLFSGTGLSRSMTQTCNLRGEVLRLMASDQPLAIDLFKGLIDRSVGRASKLLPFPAPARTFNFTTAVIGQTEAAVTSAMTLAQLGFEIYMFGTVKHPLESCPEHSNIHGFIGSEVSAISGTLGNFQIRVSTGTAERNFTVGSVILGEKSRNIALYHTHRDLPGKTVQAEMQKAQVPGLPFMNPGTTSISGLFLADPPGIQISKHTQGTAAAVLAAAAIPRGPRQYRGFLVTVNEDSCRSCGRCLQVCPYQAIALKPNNVGGFIAMVDTILCKGCGNCISVCPCNAADSPFRDQAYLEQTLEELLMDYRL